jgi:hypothetical protein
MMGNCTQPPTRLRNGEQHSLGWDVEVRRGGTVVRADAADLPARVDLNTVPPVITFSGAVTMTIDDQIPLMIAARQ